MRFTLLGSVRVHIGEETHTLPRAQTRGLLALLLINIEQPLSVDAIVGALWAGSAPSTARAQVHNSISSIRALASRWGQPDLLASGARGYQLTVEPEQVDLHLFDRQVRAARQVPDAEAAVSLFRDGLQHWKGTALADAAGAFVDGMRTHLTERRLAAIEDLVELELSLGRHRAVVPDLAQLVEVHPLRERLRAMLMLAMYRCGRQAEALHIFHTYRKMLADHEGLDPGAARR
jgi:DNA-binding SARP family transcriptional activator